MIHIVMANTPDFRTVSVKGHANADEYGKDIVCAAASALVCTLAARLEEMHRGGNVTYTIKRGDACVTYMGTPGPEVAGVFETIELGLRMLSERYPRYVEVHREG